MFTLKGMFYPVLILVELTNPAHQIIAYYLCETNLPLDRLEKLHAIVVDKLTQNPDSKEALNLYLEVLMAIHFLTRDSTLVTQDFIQTVFQNLESILESKQRIQNS